MTEERKTLKDFERSECHGDGRCYCDIHPIANVDELKAEAIKWVKAFRKNMVIHIEDGKKDTIPINYKSLEKVFMIFFNLTEEDLK